MKKKYIYPALGVVVLFLLKSARALSGRNQWGWRYVLVMAIIFFGSRLILYLWRKRKK